MKKSKKEGTLFRPGKVIKSRWKEVYCALSKTGFLHYFEDRKAMEPFWSIHVPDCTVTLATQLDKYAMEISVPNNRLFSFSSNPIVYHLKATTEELLVDWMVALKRYIPIKTN